MPNALVELAEQPLMSGRKNDNVATPPNELCGGEDLITIVMNVFQDIHIQDAVKSWTLSKRIQ